MKYIYESNRIRSSVEGENLIQQVHGKFLEFKKTDYYGYAGATALPDGSEPLIYEGEAADIIISGSEYSGDLYSVSINNENFAAGNDEIKSKEEALKLANTLIKYADDGDYDYNKVCKRLGMETYFN